MVQGQNICLANFSKLFEHGNLKLNWNMRFIVVNPPTNERKKAWKFEVQCQNIIACAIS